MAIRKHGIIIEMPAEARRAELGPLLLAVLGMGTVLAVLILAGAWFVFFGT
jgi:hypothetical protein